MNLWCSAIAAIASVAMLPSCTDSHGRICDIGECSSSSSSGASSAWHELWHPPQTEEEIRADYMKQYTDNTKPCAAGKPVACVKLAQAQLYFKDSPAAIGKSYSIACAARYLETYNGTTTCFEAGKYAELPTGAGPAAALVAYASGCSVADVMSCHAAIRLDPKNTPTYASSACQAKDPEGCVIVATTYADPQSPQYNLARAKEILISACRYRNSACAMLGKLEVQELTKP